MFPVAVVYLLTLRQCYAASTQQCYLRDIQLCSIGMIHGKKSKKGSQQ